MGGLVGSFVPIIGTVVGAWIGTAVGAFLSHVSSGKHEMLAARNQASAIFGGWLSNGYVEMSQKIASVLEQIKRNITRGVTEAIADLMKEKADHIAELKQMGQRSAEEIAAKSVALEKRRRVFEQAVAEMRGEAVNAEKGA